MKKNHIIIVLSSLAMSALLASCGQANTTSSAAQSSTQAASSAQATSQAASTSKTNTSTAASSAVAASPIKAVTAISATVKMKVEEQFSITSYYTITATSGSLTTKQKLCTYASSNDKVVAISGKIMAATGIGTATITVTSSLDTTKSCTFDVTVSDVAFDRALSAVSTDDNFDHETDATDPYVETNSMMTSYLYFKGVNSTRWVAETTISLHAVATSEDWPKLGIGTNTFAEGGLANNQVYFHLNAEQPHASESPLFNQIGVVEVANSTEWAWNPTVTDATARHKDHAYQLPTPVTYDTEFKMKVVRDVFNFHLFVNDVYAFSIETLHDLFGVEGVAQKSYPELFEFNSDVKFSNYSATADEAKVTAAVATITTPKMITAWDQDAQ